jgi:hypothetical protein
MPVLHLLDETLERYFDSAMGMPVLHLLDEALERYFDSAMGDTGAAPA